MKKAFFFFAFIAVVIGCNSNDSGTGNGPRSTDEDTLAKDVQVVENVNGNIPDTTNSINLGTETISTDSTPR